MKVNSIEKDMLKLQGLSIQMGMLIEQQSNAVDNNNLIKDLEQQCFNIILKYSND
jgi:hypothetical protein